MLLTARFQPEVFGLISLQMRARGFAHLAGGAGISHDCGIDLSIVNHRREVAD